MHIELWRSKYRNRNNFLGKITKEYINSLHLAYWRKIHFFKGGSGQNKSKLSRMYMGYSFIPLTMSVNCQVNNRVNCYRWSFCGKFNVFHYNWAFAPFYSFTGKPRIVLDSFWVVWVWESQCPNESGFAILSYWYYCWQELGIMILQKVNEFGIWAFFGLVFLECRTRSQHSIVRWPQNKNKREMLLDSDFSSLKWN